MLLAHAASRDSGSPYPLPDNLNGAARATKAVAALTERGMTVEREVTELALVSRTEKDVRFGVFLTDAGRAAINVGPAAEESPATETPSAGVPAKAPSKAEAVLTLLRREHGANLAELIEATGWLPLTTRAALTGLRKKGHAIERGKRDEVTCYTVPVLAA